jgi:hypothetical protein
MVPQSLPGKNILDISLAGTTMSAPVWLTSLETYIGVAVAVCGFILLILRIILSWKELRGPKYGKGSDDPTTK